VSHNLSQTISLLKNTPAALNSLLRDLPDSWTAQSEGPNTWTPTEIIAHLIHCERTDWMPRVRMILQAGESQTFTPLDREGNLRESKSNSLPQLLDEFSRLRSENLSELRSLNLQQKDLELRGRHPAFGSVTLSQLLATWATHDLTHLHQLSRVMAAQYRTAVGPWSVYLGVLQCTGHSSS
jgi:hypothetical protein